MMLCCKKLTDAIEEEMLERDSGGINIHKVRLVDDGDEHYDDMGQSWRIDFCPFCGASLNFLKGEEKK